MLPCADGHVFAAGLPDKLTEAGNPPDSVKAYKVPENVLPDRMSFSGTSFLLRSFLLRSFLLRSVLLTPFYLHSFTYTVFPSFTAGAIDRSAV